MFSISFSALIFFVSGSASTPAPKEELPGKRWHQGLPDHLQNFAWGLQEFRSHQGVPKVKRAGCSRERELNVPDCCNKFHSINPKCIYSEANLRWFAQSLSCVCRGPNWRNYLSQNCFQHVPTFKKIWISNCTIWGWLQFRLSILQK